MPKIKARIERIEIADPENDEWRYVQLDGTGDIYIQDGAGDDALNILIRKHMLAPLISALRLAGRL